VGASRIVFTGGDPVQRAGLGELLLYAKTCGLEVALSTTGDALTPEFLATVSPALDLISLPLDGPNEEINARTKKPGHFAAIQRVLEWLRAYPAIDVKLCTPVTRHNLAHVPVILDLAEAYAQTTRARVFYNVFQAFPRAMFEVNWQQLLVTDAEFAALEQQLANRTTIRVNFLSHATLDRLYVMIFPDGSLVIPRGSDYLTYGPFLAVDDLEAALAASQFDTAKHLRHAEGWRRLEGGNDVSR
jgi:MoaA/NifB/PqqE/SkfB family radical SAM enzyme